MQPRKARIAVIGTGWWATYAHLPALVQRPDVEVVALANRGTDKLRTAAATFRVAHTYTNYREMLDKEDVDGVVVATSHAAHYEAAKAALEHDCHVLVEKPLTLKTNEARELIDLARSRKKAIVMSCPWGFTPHTLRAREIVRAGELGEIQLVTSLFTSWAGVTYRDNREALDRVYDSGLFAGTLIRARSDANTDPQRGGGQGWCQVSHSAALAFWVTGLNAQEVSAYLNRLDAAVDVVDALSMKLSNGATGVLASTGNLPMGDAGQHGLWVYGSNGYLVLDLIAGTLLIQRKGQALESLAPLPPEDRYPRFVPVDNFIDLILYQAENRNPGEIGYRVVAFLEAVYQSAANGAVPTQVPDK